MNRNLLFATIVSALGSFLFGFDTAVISGTTKYITSFFNLTDSTLGITVSIALWGTVIGSIAVGKPGDLYGRRFILFICGALYFISGIGCALANGWYFLLFFRFLGGLAIGASSVIAPMYIAEISPGKMRGRLVAVAQFNIVLGILAAFFSNFLLVDTGLNNWRWMFGVESIPALLFFILLFFVPETPRWLVKKSRIENAENVLTSVGSSDVKAELSSIIDSLTKEEGKKGSKLFQRKYRFAIMCAVLLAVFNQLSGINVIMYYAPMIFEKAGSDTNAAMLQAVAVGLTNMLFTIIAMFFIDKFGRKTLLLIGAVGMFITLAGAAFNYYDESIFGSAGVVVFIIGFISFFAVSQGAVIWVFLAEVFPNKVRSKGQSLGSFTHWVMNSLIGLIFPIALSKFGGGNVFMFFSIMMIPFFLFVWKVMPETKEKSLEELEKLVVSE